MISSFCPLIDFIPWICVSSNRNKDLCASSVIPKTHAGSLPSSISAAFQHILRPFFNLPQIRIIVPVQATASVRVGL